MQNTAVQVNNFQRQAKRSAIVLAGFTFLCGALVLVGWQFDIDFFKRPIAGLVAMNPLTALCFILSSAAMVLITGGNFNGRWRFAGYLLAWLVLIAGCIKVAQLAGHSNTGIDTLLFPARLEKDVVGNVSNRMAPNTAANFILTALALLLLNRKTRTGHVPAQALALFIAAMGMLSLMGYLYNVRVFYGVLAYIPMAIHTAVCFLLLAVAILSVRSSEGFMLHLSGSHPGSVIARKLIPAAVIIPVALGFLKAIAEWRGLITPDFASAVIILLNMFILLGLVWYNARELNREDVNRRHAEEQMRMANKELESFSYSVSHDLRAPLRAIHGYTKILKEDYTASLDNDAQKMMDSVMANAIKMGQLNDDLLAFSRIGRKELLQKDIDMNALVTEVCREIIPPEQLTRINLVLNPLSPASGDREVIKQVWVNLVSNAVKYSRHHHQPVVEIGCSAVGHEVIYYVRDNGAGFDMRYADKLFGVFQRLHSQSEFEGTGVGLAIVERIITRHQGRVWAEAKINQGATFYFALPVLQSLN